MVTACAHTDPIDTSKQALPGRKKENGCNPEIATVYYYANKNEADLKKIFWVGLFLFPSIGTFSKCSKNIRRHV